MTIEQATRMLREALKSRHFELSYTEEDLKELETLAANS